MITRLAHASRLSLATLLIVLSAFTLSTAPTSAHSTEVRHGNDYVVTAGDHKSGYVCDRESDGHAVSAEWRDFTGHKGDQEVDKTDPGCDEITFDGFSAAEVRICEHAKYSYTCTDWHDT
jgi:hypothetical protein